MLLISIIFRLFKTFGFLEDGRINAEDAEDERTRKRG